MPSVRRSGHIAPSTAVGFIGLGVMGRPMARNILRAGFDLVVNSRTRSSVESLVGAGARAADSAADVAAMVEVLIVMVPDTADLRAVVDGPSGVVAGAHADLVVCDMGTHAPNAMAEIESALSRAGAAFLDAPVSGGEIGAQDGSLAIMAGGSAHAFRKAEPVFLAMGTNVVHIGEIGAGQVAKACNQLVVGSTIQAVAEALALSEALGTDPEKVREVMMGGFAASRVLEIHGRRMLDGAFEPGARVGLHAKDAHIVLEAAESVGLLLPGFSPVASALDDLAAQGGAGLDHSALITLLRPRPS